MEASISQRLATPVVVDSTFLRELDSRLRTLRPQIIAQSAAFRDMPEAKLAKQLERGTPPADSIEAIIYNEVLGYVEPKYTIKWRNDVTLQVNGVESAIEALELEYTIPVRIEGEIGYYGRTYASLSIDSIDLYPSRLTVKGTIEVVRSTREAFINCLRKHSPEYAFLHDIRFKLATITAICLVGVGNIFYSGGVFASADTGEKKIVSVAMLAVGSIIWACLYTLYGKAFPTVVWRFGAGLKQAGLQKLFIGLTILLVSAVIIPTVLS